MVAKTVTILTSDLSEKELKPGEGRTIVFGVEAGQYEIDLSEKEIEGLYKALDPYLSAGRKLARNGKAYTRTTVPTKTPAKAVKAWLDEIGVAYPERGRLPKVLTEAYEAKDVDAAKTYDAR